MHHLIQQSLKIAVLLYISSAIALAQVGMQNIQFGNLPVTLTYPTVESAKPHSFGAFQIDVALNAKPHAGLARLIVMSHGAGGSALSDHQLASTFAKAGYLVAQPQHAGDNYKDVSKAGPESWKSRPLEITQVIDALTLDPLWSGRFDVNKVGVYGMSAGGATALAIAGAQWNMLTLVKHCGKNLEADIGFCLYGLNKNKTTQAKISALYQSAAMAPESFLPSHLKTIFTQKPDSRIKAVAAAVPVVAIFTAESIANIQIPIGVITAGSDQLLAPIFHSDYLLANCKTCSRAIDLKNAAHFDVLSPWPDAVAQQVSAIQMRGGNLSPTFDPADRAKAFSLIVQFFNKHL